MMPSFILQTKLDSAPAPDPELRRSPKSGVVRERGAGARKKKVSALPIVPIYSTVICGVPTPCQTWPSGPSDPIAGPPDPQEAQPQTA